MRIVARSLVVASLLSGSIRRRWCLVHLLAVLGNPLAVASVPDGTIESLFGLHLLVDEPDCKNKEMVRKADPGQLLRSW